ncbi:hypothetical protein [Cellulomonas persica]|uniref:DUF1129 domain-containing protein n=1 Tax=Cellulomonas persica TaxID=76861 RepID=A0A510UT44_9CELL|nr:hypothetical protein [Cellulomonas persica]GEK17656.1 hypothetical protein CPE01_13890 [Cellulomonas persica]
MTKETTGRRYAIERSLAPHVDAQWAEAVLVELRLQGVAGTAIAEVLSEVESHVVESGEDALTAFGDPVQFAQSLELPADPRQDLTVQPSAVVLSAAQVLGALLVVGGAAALGAGEPAPITWGLLMSALAATLLTLVVLRVGTRLLRVVVSAPVRSRQFAAVVAAGTAAFALVVLPAALLREVVLELPGPLALGLGALTLAATTGFSLWHDRLEPDDLIVSPFDDALDDPRDSRHRAPWVAQLALLLPVALAAVAVYVLVRTGA